MNAVFVRFDHNLDYKAVVNSFYIKKFLESVFGELPNMITPRNFLFERDKLGEFIQDQYNHSIVYVLDSKRMPANICESYGKDLALVEFEPEILTDDHLVTVNCGDKVLGVFATEDDFGKIVNELNLSNNLQ